MESNTEYKVGEIYQLESGKFTIWYGISFVGTYKSRAEAEAFWAKENAAMKEQDMAAKRKKKEKKAGA
jgi:hypothetical protein